MDERMIWAIETTNSGAGNIGVLIDTSAAAIVSKIVEDGLAGS
jgi:hypothetical protein